MHHDGGGKLNKSQQVYDLVAAADIEDIMLVDIAGICRYLGCQVIPRESLPGRKGAAKMKQLFRQNGQCYHKGSRAKALIDALDMQMIIDGGILDLDRVEDILFDDS